MGGAETRRVAAAFAPDVGAVERFGGGHINDTFGGLKSYRAIGDDTVEYVFDEPASPFLHSMAMEGNWVGLNSDNLREVNRLIASDITLEGSRQIDLDGVSCGGVRLPSVRGD